MPIVDGLTSTKMIRSQEKTTPGPATAEASTAAPPPWGRTPIIAVSASLVESQRPTYVEAGFDGWILKPIDFKRLATLLEGIHDQSKRDACLYAPGRWEHGGWFHARQLEARDAETRPEKGKEAGTGPPPDSFPQHKEDVIGDEQRRLEGKESKG